MRLEPTEGTNSFQEIPRDSGQKLQLFESDSDNESTIEWELEKIVEKRYSENGTEYLIKWVNNDEETWEPKNNLTDCAATIQTFQLCDPAFVMVKDLQKNLPLPKFDHQPSNYYHKVQCY